MHELKMLSAMVVGAIAGLAATLPFMMGYFLVYYGVRCVFSSLPHDPSPQLILPFILGVYAIWFSLVVWSASRSGQLKAVHLLLFVLPLPSIVIEQMWHSSHVI